MLSFLSIRDLAIIDHVELEFDSGFTALTGETGAGKSILLDGLQLALGARADSALVRAEQPRAEIVACFDPGPHLGDWLSQHDLEAGDELMLRRVVNADGRSRAWINGTPVPVQTLKDLGGRLVEFHGQNEHQFLQKRSRQLQLLDGFAGGLDQVTALSDLFQDWRAKNTELDNLRAETALAPAERELLEFQVEELREHALSPDDLEALETSHRSLAHSGDLLAATAIASRLVQGDEDGACQALTRALREVDDQVRHDPRLQEAKELIESSLIQAQEAGAVLSRFENEIDVDPSRLDEIDEQLSRVHQLARKHRVEPTDLLARLDELESRLKRASASDEEEQRLAREIETLEAAYREQSAALSEQRTAAAHRLSEAVTATMAELGMEKGAFEVSVRFDEERPFGANGQDEVEFRITTNPGSPLQPLSKVASGGELSRICLAIKVVGAEADVSSTMIFDEVDAGVGGAVAQIVGEKLRQVAGDRQVFSVTHLPQVASCGHHHLQISKSSSTDATQTRVEALSEEQRVEEIARMLGGVEITDTTTEHAREMLERAKD